MKYFGAVEDFDAEGERKVRAFTLWLSSLNVEPAVFNLFENLCDGLIILQAFNEVQPGPVVWRRVLRPKGAAPVSMMDEGEGEEDIGVKPNQSTLTRMSSGDGTKG